MIWDSREVTLNFCNVIAILALLIAPLSSAHAAEESRVTFWYPEVGAPGYMEGLLSEFTRSSGIAVDKAIISIDDLKVALVKQAKRDALPDVVLCPSDYISLQQELKLSSIPKSLRTFDISTDHWRTTSIRDIVYGIPMISGNHLMLLYNKLLVDKVPTTWEQFKELRKKSSGPIVGWNYREMYWFAPFILTLGGNLVNNDRPALESQAVVKALVTYKELADAGVVDPNCTYSCASADFYSGKYRFAIDGDTALEQAYRRLGDKLGIAKLPTLDGKPMRSYSSSYALIFPSESLLGPKKTALNRLATYLLSPEIQQLLWKQARRIPIITKDRAKLKATASGNEQQMLSGLADSVVMPSVPAMTYAWESLRRGFILFMNGELGAEAASQRMQVEALRDLQKISEGGKR